MIARTSDSSGGRLSKHDFSVIRDSLLGVASINGLEISGDVQPGRIDGDSQFSCGCLELVVSEQSA